METTTPEAGGEQLPDNDFITQTDALAEDYEHVIGQTRREELEGGAELTLEERFAITQHHVAETKSRLMQPGFRGWVFRRKHRAQYEAAQELNAVALGYRFLETAQDFERDADDNNNPADSPELRAVAVSTIIDNKKKIDELVIENYAGKKSNSVFDWIRRQKTWARGSISFMSSVLLTPLPSAFLARSLSKHNVANHLDVIRSHEKDSTDELQARLEGLDGNLPNDLLSMVLLTRKEMDDSIQREQERIAEQVGPIAVGAVAGVTLNVVGNTVQRLW